MSRQIHRVVKNSEHVNHTLIVFIDSEHDEVPPLASLASHVDREQSRDNIVSYGNACHCRAGG